MGLLKRFLESRRSRRQITAEQQAARAAGKSYPECRWRVEIAACLLRVVGFDGDEESVPLDAIRRIVVRTTSDGPFLPDVWWGFFHEHGAVEFPQGAEGDRPVIEWARSLPGYKFENEIAAMGCAEDNLFVVCER